MFLRLVVDCAVGIGLWLTDVFIDAHVIYYTYKMYSGDGDGDGC